MLKIHWSRMPLPNLYTFILYTVGTYTAVPLLFLKGFLVFWIFSSVADPNTLNLDPDPGFWPNLDPDPGLYNQF